MRENILIDQGCFKSAKCFYKSFRKGGVCPHNLQVASFLWITSLKQMAFYELFYILLPPKYWLNSRSYQQPLLQSNRFKEFKNCINQLLRDNCGSFHICREKGKTLSVVIAMFIKIYWKILFRSLVFFKLNWIWK